MEDKNHNGQAASEVCDICNSAPKRHFCIECAQHFCDYCKGLHTRQTATRQHEFQGSSEIKQNGKCNCMKYDEDCISICDDCHVLVCSRCGAGKEGKHDGHKVCNLNERISMLNTIVKEEIETSLQKDFSILNELENGVDAYDSEVKSVIKGIREDEQKMKQMIDEKVKSMLDDIKMKTSCEKNKMAKLVTDTKSRIETKTALEDRRKHIRKEIPNLAVFYDMTTLHERFSQIGIVVSPSYPSIDYKPNKASGIKMLSVLGSYMLRPLTYNLPKRIEMRRDKDGKSYFADHNTNSTTLDYPMPIGWEMRYDRDGRQYFVNHNNRSCTWRDPRQKDFDS